MSPRTFGLLMLLFCSAMAGAAYARLSAAPADERAVAVADAAETQPATPERAQAATVQTNAQPVRTVSPRSV